MLRKNPEHRPTVSLYLRVILFPMLHWFPTVANLEQFHYIISQASEVLKHPYLLPYVDQYRSSFCTPTVSSPEKPISVVHHPRKNKPEGQNSSSSSTEKDSLMSNMKKTANAVPKCDGKSTELDMTPVEDDGSEQLRPDEEGNGSIKVNAKTVDQVVTKQFNNDHNSKVVSKQPIAIKNVVTALRNRKLRETSSPIRGNSIKGGGVLTHKINTETLSKLPKLNFGACDLKSNLEVPTIAPSKATPDPAKRLPGSHTSKHQVHNHYKCFSVILVTFEDSFVTLKFISGTLIHAGSYQ